MPWSKVLSFTDPFPYQSAIRAADIELFPTSRGEFRAELTQICMDQLWMQRFYQHLPHVYAGTIRPGRKVIGFSTETNSPTMQHCGMDVSPGDIVVNNSDMFHRRAKSDAYLGTMSLTFDVFDAACKAITGREFSGASLRRLVRPTPALMSRLLKLHKMVGQLAKNSPDILELPEVARGLEEKLIHVMIRCLTDGTALQIGDGNRRHGVIVARFEDYLAANPYRPLYLTEICAAIGIAERTLRSACEDHLGMGPVRYLSLRRMHLVRRALSRADPSISTVTRIATDHGFWELGHFAVAYKGLFGQSPSASLQRPPDDGRIFEN